MPRQPLAVALNYPMQTSSPPPISPRVWPIGLNIFLSVFLVSNHFEHAGGAHPIYLFFYVALTTTVNVFGALAAMWGRKWSLAAWYGVGLLFMVTLVGLVLIGSHPIEQRPETIDE